MIGTLSSKFTVTAAVGLVITGLCSTVTAHAAPSLTSTQNGASAHTQRVTLRSTTAAFP